MLSLSTQRFPESLLELPTFVDGLSFRGIHRPQLSFLDSSNISGGGSAAASSIPALLRVLSGLFRQLLHLPLLFSLFPALLRVLCCLAHALLLLVSGNFDKAAAKGHISVWCVRLVSNRLDEVAKIDVRNRMRLRGLRSEASIRFDCFYRPSNSSIVCKRPHREKGLSDLTRWRRV